LCFLPVSPVSFGLLLPLCGLNAFHHPIFCPTCLGATPVSVLSQVTVETTVFRYRALKSQVNQCALPPPGTLKDHRKSKFISLFLSHVFNIWILFNITKVILFFTVSVHLDFPIFIFIFSCSSCFVFGLFFFGCPLLTYC
jgi:hypothetical protein